MSTARKIILYDDAEAATPYTMQGWKSSDGYFYKDEQAARYQGCTHRLCDCGNIMDKMYTICEDCRNKKTWERYKALPEGKLDYPVYSETYDKYFFNEDDILEFLDEIAENEEGPENLRLLLCSPNYMQLIENDYWDDVWPEDHDGELPKAVQEALDTLNKAIQNCGPVSYSPTKTRTSYQTTNP